MPVQLVPARPVEAPKPKPVVKTLDWNFAPKELPSVHVAVVAAIAKNSVRTESKPVKVEPVKPVPSVRTGNLHSHQCGRCGAIFSHDSSNHGNVQAHMCPQCGYGPNFRIIGR